MTNDIDETAVERNRQLLRFLKAFAQQRQPTCRTLAEQLWSMELASLPKHPEITIGTVTLATAATHAARDAESEADTGSLLRVGRPKLTRGPALPSVLTDWMVANQDAPNEEPKTVESRNFTRGGELVTEAFNDDPERLRGYEEWMVRRKAWAEAEKPARAAMQVFERLYELHSRIQRESEAVELILGDGRLRWKPEGHAPVDHPVVLQRVDLIFDQDVPEIRVVDSDRAPELYGELFEAAAGNMPATALNAKRDELANQGYHPLAAETSAFLKGLVQLASARGQFREAFDRTAAGPEPVLSRGPVLLLRKRSAGYASAFDRVLVDLERRRQLPSSLQALVGVEPSQTTAEPWSDFVPWCSPPDVLLSKPANAEQVRIARAVSREGAVLVQGPPGTGKTYTIANLVGHFVAHGKRVLVTSHTTKALRVLRDQVVEQLRPLCLAVLENDTQANAQLGKSVTDILSRLSSSVEEDLEREVADFTKRRGVAHSRIRECSDALRAIRAAEYEPIIVAGESTTPSDATRWVESHRETSSWIPGPIAPGSPLPLSAGEVATLYETNDSISPDVDLELSAGLFDAEAVPSPEQFGALVGALAAEESPQSARYWDRAPSSEQSDRLEELQAVVGEMAILLGESIGWQQVVINAGYTGAGERELWLRLRDDTLAAHRHWESSRMLLVERQVQLGETVLTESALEDVRALRVHVEGGGSLGWFSLLRHSRWKAVQASVTVNGLRPSTTKDLLAVEAELHRQLLREQLARLWGRVAEPAGLTALNDIPAPIEPRLAEVATKLDGLLNWWSARWTAVESAAYLAGLRLAEVRDAQSSAGLVPSPFERDRNLVEHILPALVAERLAVVDRAVAVEQLAHLSDTLESSPGEGASVLRAAVNERDEKNYAETILAIREVAAAHPTWLRRQELLSRLAAVAPQWAKAITMRESEHGLKNVPGNPVDAWRWCQLAQEIERRRGLDERLALAQLEEHLGHMRDLTTELIDRRSWLAQLRRVNLPARQALQGWTDIQRRIGRGTGRRVPQLQAEARKLLLKARDAVPVWIMPMARVAESFDPAKGRFDVVILDEASQSDVTGLLAWYLGDQVIVVGDDEQVSPLAVGDEQAAAAQLIEQHLVDVPNSVLFDGKLSVYDLAKQCFGGTIALREHFRCVPDIIGFSNELSYAGEIQPLRSAAKVPSPHVVEYIATGDPGTVAKQNLAEARAIAALVKAMTEDSRFHNKSIGAIALMGDQQPELIYRLLLPLVGPAELERHRFAAGSPPEFQGDERDIILLSMVDVPRESGRLPIRQTDTFKKRFNVAASRAKDHLWLVHSLEPERDLQSGDLRRRLIEYVRDPGAHRRIVEKATRRAESPFEEAVIKGLLDRGFEVEPQVSVGKYRIDMVVSDGEKRVAVECDGDRFHGIDKIPEDMARQAILERAGWRFVRIRGTHFFRDPEGGIDWLTEELRKRDVHPVPVGNANGPAVPVSEPMRSSIVRRAHEIMMEMEWTVTRDGSVPEELPRV